MEEDKLIESKKILTDYMLELNRDIQSAEDWVNTGADEEMYFALQTVLNELDRLQKENKKLEEENMQLEAIKDEAIKKYNFDSIPKSKIENKIETYRRVVADSNDGDLIYNLRTEIHILEELLEND